MRASHGLACAQAANLGTQVIGLRSWVSDVTAPPLDGIKIQEIEFCLSIVALQ